MCRSTDLDNIYAHPLPWLPIMDVETRKVSSPLGFSIGVGTKHKYHGQCSMTRTPGSLLLSQFFCPMADCCRGKASRDGRACLLVQHAEHAGWVCAWGHLPCRTLTTHHMLVGPTCYGCRPSNALEFGEPSQDCESMLAELEGCVCAAASEDRVRMEGAAALCQAGLQLPPQACGAHAHRHQAPQHCPAGGAILQREPLTACSAIIRGAPSQQPAMLLGAICDAAYM